MLVHFYNSTKHHRRVRAI